MSQRPPVKVVRDGKSRTFATEIQCPFMGVLWIDDHDGVFSLILLRWFNHLQVISGSGDLLLFKVHLKWENCQFGAFCLMQEEFLNHLKGTDCCTSIVAMEGVPPISSLSLWMSLVSLG